MAVMTIQPPLPFAPVAGARPLVPGFLSITLDPMGTTRETRAVAELCGSLTEPRTRYPGTDLVLQYAIKERL